ADLRYVQRTRDTGKNRREGEDPELIGLDAIADEARAAFRIAHGLHDAAGPRLRDVLARQIPQRQSDCGCDEQRHARSRRMNVETEDLLEVRQPVVAAESHVVAEEG